MPNLVIRVECGDSKDVSFLLIDTVAAVKKQVKEDENRLNGKVTVSWEIED